MSRVVVDDLHIEEPIGIVHDRPRVVGTGNTVGAVGAATSGGGTVFIRVLVFPCVSILVE